MFPSGRLGTPVPNAENLVLVACGAFNPVTFMHLRMFETAKDYLRVEYNVNVIGGIISPANDAYGKPGLVEGVHRASMLELAVEDSDWVSVDRWEIEQDEFQITRVLLAHVTEEVTRHFSSKSMTMDNVRVALVCGADLLAAMSRGGVWAIEDSEVILGTHGVVCLERTGFDLVTLIKESPLLRRFADRIQIVPAMITNDVSSTKIRDFVRRGFSTRYLIHDSVRTYINEHGFYLDHDTPQATPENLEEEEES